MSQPDPAPEEIELLVVGGGTAGLLAARTARTLGARVTMVERDPAPGGDCLWTGCVPSKALLAEAGRVATVRAGAHGLGSASGIGGTSGTVDFASVMAAVQQAVATIAPHDSIDSLVAAGVEVVTGTARFVAPDTVEVAGRRLRFEQAVLATGAEPLRPVLPGVDEVEVLTSETLWSLPELPARLLVLGGGSTGCEMAQAFARLGSVVTLVETGARLLTAEDPRASALVRHALEADGVEVRCASSVSRLSPGTAELADETQVHFDRVLAAVGRTARTSGLGTAVAGVELDARGRVVVDDHLRTTNPRIWAAGDVTAHPQYTHLAGVHASMVATHAVLGVPRRAAAALVPRVTFTDPEVAAVGAAPGTGATELVVQHRDLDRAVVERRSEGFTSVVLDRRGRVVGACIVGPRAGETVGEAALAVQQKVSVGALVTVTHPYPTFNDGLWNAVVEHYQRGLGGRGAGLVLGLLRRVARVRRRHGSGRLRP